MAAARAANLERHQNKNNKMALIRILVISAKNLKQIKATGSSGYYVSVRCSGAVKSQKKTKIVGKTNNPVWKEKFEFQLTENLQDFKFVFLVKSAGGFPSCSRNRISGWNEIAFENLAKLKEIDDENYELHLLDKNNQPTYGTLQLKFQLTEELKVAAPGVPIKPEVQTDSGYFMIDVFHADGLPRMDFGNIFDFRKAGRQLVDSYLMVSFMDKRVTSSIIPHSVTPVWNERLYLSFDFPLQSDSIKIELKDEDIFTGDDLIATTWLSISELTAKNQEGCLPSFGPAFINFYGSQRQFRISESDKVNEMNSGMAEGCSYRGRVFLQIQTGLGRLADDVKQEISELSVAKSQKFGRTKKYILRAAFLECFSLRSQELSTLEISFGLFGNSEIEDSRFWRPSCVPSFLPIRSGGENTHVYHAFWGTDKPCIIYSVEAPSSLIRLKMRNFVLSLARRLDVLVQRLVKMQGQEIDLKNLEDRIEKFVSDFTSTIAGFSDFSRNSDSSTELDIQISEMSQNRLNDISAKMASSKVSPVYLEKIIANFTEICRDLQELGKILPQNEFPDLFLWLYQDWRRLAYCRIPVIDVLFSENSDERGLLCNQNSSWTFKYPYDVKEAGQVDPGVIRANFWFGPEENLTMCLSSDEKAGSAYTMFAETYENRIGCCGKFKKALPLVRWTDFLGQKYFRKSNFPVADGWAFDGEWTSEEQNLPSLSKDSSKVLELKHGVDANEVKHLTEESPELKPSSLSEKVQPPKMVSPKSSPQKAQTKSPNVKPVRWRRKMVPSGTTVLPMQSTLRKKVNEWFFHFPNPIFYLLFQEFHYYELKIYLYQARNLSAGDRSGFSDPFVRFIFLSKEKDSKLVAESLCPVWNQTLVISNVPLAGRPLTECENLPEVNAELYDHDTDNHLEYLGKALFQPVIGPIKQLSSNFLIWRPITLDDNVAGDLLVSAELSLKADQNFSENVTFDHDEVTELPSEVKPKMATANLEILCIGLRNWDSGGVTLTRPFVEILCDSQTPVAITDEIEQFPQLTDFGTKVFNVDLVLPEDPVFLPSLTIRLKNKGHFSQISTVGACVVTNMKQFVTKDTKFVLFEANNEEETVIDMKESQVRLQTSKPLIALAEDAFEEDSDVDWWSKYYASKGEPSRYGEFFQRGFKPIQIYDSDLESLEPLKSAMNVIRTLPIYSGKSLSGETQSLVAELKATFSISFAAPQSRKLVNLQSQDYSLAQMALRVDAILPDVLLRVYLIRAYDLQAMDIGKESDPYIRVEVGETGKRLDESLRRNSLNPIFGCIFESVITLPRDSRLVIKILDNDVISDDLIGETRLDLESRILAPCWATCGLAPQYMTRGPYAWRETKPPTKIFKEMCALRGIPDTEIDSSKLMKLHNIKLDLQDAETSLLEPFQGPAEERLALSMLRQLNYGVPEHVETRTLFHPSKTGIPQGKLEMWVDMFPMKEADLVPPPVNVSPRTPKSYVLRCIVYNAYEVPMDDKNLLGDEMTDVYVKAWLKGLEVQWQTTDVHHRSIDGEANFNWRFVFPFQFLHGENTIVHQKRKRFFDSHLTEMAIPPVLCVEIHDYDVISRDDLLGTLELELSSLLPPKKRRKHCKPNKKRKSTQEPHINLFKQKHIRGYWVCPSFKAGQGGIGGKLELELELLTEEQAQLRPAGLGRDEPNSNPKLENPRRPSTSFFWLTSPLKFLKFLLCKRFRKFFIIIILAAFGIFVLYLVIERFLDASIHKLVYSI